jgi:hypothetical protein
VFLLLIGLIVIVTPFLCSGCEAGCDGVEYCEAVWGKGVCDEYVCWEWNGDGCCVCERAVGAVVLLNTCLVWGLYGYSSASNSTMYSFFSIATVNAISV